MIEGLMIGDWVFCTYPSINTPVKVAEIKTVGDNELKAVVYHDDIRLVFCEKYLDPISLTPEILEKNGWVKFRVWYRLRIDDSQYIEYYPHKGRLERIYDHKDGWHEVVFTIAGLNYVHQIQHALRLCGISKDITL